MPVKTLTFDEAFRRFKLTLPGVPEFSHETSQIRIDKDSELSVEVVRYFQHRLNTHVRNVGGWTFLAENAFLNTHVGRLFLAWRWHGGGMLTNNTPLEAAMRHCFKRFYAESALAECNTLTARTLLIEAAVLERDLLKPINDLVRSEPKVEEFSQAFVSCAQFIAYHHEIGHINCRASGSRPDEMARSLIDGVAEERLRDLHLAGRHELAEEVYCDLRAIHEATNSPDSPLSLLDPQLRLRLAFFGFVCVAYLSLVSFEARSDSRREFLGLSALPPSEQDEFHLASSSVRERMFMVADEIERYAKVSDIALYGRTGEFDLVYSPVSQFLEILVNFKDVGPSMNQDSPTYDAAHRNIARFLALAIPNDHSTAKYLLWCSEDPAAEPAGEMGDIAGPQIPNSA